MTDKSTLDPFLEPPTPEEEARQKANAEVREKMGNLKNQLQKELGKLRGLRRRENVPTVQASLDEQIAQKQKEFRDVDCINYAATTEADLALQKHVKDQINYAAIMKKHGVPGY